MSEKPPGLDPNYGSAIRLSQIVHWLHQNPFGLSLGDVRQRLGISERTLARYLTTLKETFLDEEGEAMLEVVRSTTSQGRLRWRQRRLPMEGTAYELLSLYMALEMMTFLDGTLFHQSAQEAILRLQAVLARSQDTRTTLLLKDFHKKFFHWPEAPKDYSSHNKMLDRLVQALVFQKKMELTYQAPGRIEKTHVVSPLSLLMFRRALYLVARRELKIGENEITCKDITFAAERIKEIRILEVGFSYPPDYEPAARFQSSFGLVHETNPELVVLHFDQTVKPNVATRRWHPSQELQETTEGLLLRMQVEVGFELIAWLMGYGHHVRVLEPEHLRLKLREQAQLALKAYDQESGIAPPLAELNAQAVAETEPKATQVPRVEVTLTPDRLRQSMDCIDDYAPLLGEPIPKEPSIDPLTGLPKRGRGRPRKQRDASDGKAPVLKVETLKKQAGKITKEKKSKLPRRVKSPNARSNADFDDLDEWEILDRKEREMQFDELEPPLDFAILDED